MVIDIKHCNDDPQLSTQFLKIFQIAPFVVVRGIAGMTLRQTGCVSRYHNDGERKTFVIFSCRHVPHVTDHSDFELIFEMIDFPFDYVLDPGYADPLRNRLFRNFCSPRSRLSAHPVRFWLPFLVHGSWPMQIDRKSHLERRIIHMPTNTKKVTRAGVT